MAGTEDFDAIIDVVYKVANAQYGRGKTFVDTLANTLDKVSPGIAGEFQVGNDFLKIQQRLPSSELNKPIHSKISHSFIF